LSGVYCPIEERKFKAFVEIGNDSLTPSNGARKRQRLVWLYLKQELNILTKPATILHVAPELSYFEKLRNKKHLIYIPVDKMVEGYANQKGINQMDLINLGYEDNTFDYIICNHVLEHIPDDKKAMSEMFRVLKRSGTAVITVPLDEKSDKTFEDANITSPKDRQRYFGQWDHLRLYGVDIKNRLEEVGFSVELNKYGNNFSEKEFKKYGLCADLIVVAVKR
jgi:SAM-dependent methyltransferase